MADGTRRSEGRVQDAGAGGCDAAPDPRYRVLTARGVPRRVARGLPRLSVRRRALDMALPRTAGAVTADVAANMTFLISNTSSRLGP